MLLIGVFVVNQIKYIGLSSLPVLGDNADVKKNEYLSFIPESLLTPLRVPRSAVIPLTRAHKLSVNYPEQIKVYKFFNFNSKP